MKVLACHPETPSHAVRRVRASALRTPAGALQLRYAIEGALDRVRIPAARQPRIGEQLWQHTCCEIFVARPGLPAYHEFNFSPSGEWAAYAFYRYREGQPIHAPDPGISVRTTAEKLELEALIAVEPGKLALALAVVIEETDHRLSYWALRHPAGKPDFHHREAFAMELE
jgi:hypothetical protein